MRPNSGDDARGDDGARDDERAPLLGTWRRWYLVVLAALAAWIAIGAALSRVYR